MSKEINYKEIREKRGLSISKVSNLIGVDENLIIALENHFIKYNELSEKHIKINNFYKKLCILEKVDT